MLSAADVVGVRPLVAHSWKWINSCLKLSSKEVISSVRQDLLEGGVPPSELRIVGALLKNGEGKDRVRRRSGEYKANSIWYRAMPGRSTHVSTHWVSP